MFYYITLSWKYRPGSVNKLRFQTNKLKNLTNSNHMRIIWEKFWDKNFGPKGHPWGTWGPKNGRPIDLDFQTMVFQSPMGWSCLPWYSFGLWIFVLLCTSPDTCVLRTEKKIFARKWFFHQIASSCYCNCNQLSFMLAYPFEHIDQKTCCPFFLFSPIPPGLTGCLYSSSII